MNKFNLFFLIYLYSFGYLAFCQTSKQIKIQSNELRTGILWSQILSNKNYSFVVGFQNGNAILYNLKADSSTIFSNIGQGNFTFLSSNNVCFGSLSSTDSEENKIFIFGLTGKPKGILKIPYHGLIISYLAKQNGEKIYDVSIDFDNYRRGRTNGVISGCIYSLKQKQPLIPFDYTQSPPPSRIALPVVAEKNERIYLAIDNEYNIDIYLANGKKERSFTLPSFKNEPYSRNEIKLLSPMQQSVIREEISYPPIIKKIDVDNIGTMFITRFPRPGAGIILIDIFKNTGQFYKTLKFKINKDEILIDTCLLSKNKYALLFSSKTKRLFKIYIMIFN